ncbi:hypothetical protein BJX64DRAFT_50289 [Aspergillus heterothallicus]
MSQHSTLETDRLCISQLLWSNSDHCSFLVQLESILQVPNGRPEKTAIRRSDDAQRSLYHDDQHQWGRCGYGTFLIALKRDLGSQISATQVDTPSPEPIGKISLTTWDESGPVHATELFVSIMPKYQRCGYAIEATRALLDFVERNHGLTMFFAFAALDTPYTGAARAFARKIGLRERGLAKRYHIDGMVYTTKGMAKTVFLQPSTPLTTEAEFMNLD